MEKLSSTYFQSSKKTRYLSASLTTSLVTKRDLLTNTFLFKVLRFSKLFGLGRATSLPKLWKGSRKRKKPKTSTSVQPLGTSLQPINEQNASVEPVQSGQATDLDDDVFKMLDEAFLPPASNKENAFDSSKPLEQIKEAAIIVEQPSLTEAQQLEALTYEVDDEVDFMRPFRILEDLSENKSPTAADAGKDKLTGPEETTWRYGPASFWYETFQPSEYIITPAKVAKKPAEVTDQDEESSDEEMPGEEDKKKKKSTESEKAEAGTSSECDTIDLVAGVASLCDQVKEDKYLLVSTMKWEDNILIDLGQRESAGGQSGELVNERIKYAGWIPSGEHRTLHSYQSKVLGKKVDFLETYKEQTVAATGGGSSKQNSQQQQQATLPVVWNSIFPNENYDLFLGEWEKKIILDHKVNLSLFI